MINYSEKHVLFIIYQGTHGTGKTEKIVKKNPCQGKHREFGNFANHREFVFSSCKFPDSKDKGYICRGNFQFFPRSWIGLPTQFYVCNSHNLCKLAQGKFGVGQGKHREFENTI